MLSQAETAAQSLTAASGATGRRLAQASHHVRLSVGTEPANKCEAVQSIGGPGPGVIEERIRYGTETDDVREP
jgi:hypothetical protein